MAPLAVLAWAALLLQACGRWQDPTFTSLEPPEPASARIFLNGGDVSSHVAINLGFPQEVEVRLYAANGVHVSGYDDHFEVTIVVDPAHLAIASDVPGRPLFKLLTPGNAGPAKLPARTRNSRYDERRR